MSRRVRHGHERQEEGENVIQSVDAKYCHLLKHLPFVQVKFSDGPEGHIKGATDGDFCHVDEVIRKEGATRVLKIAAEEEKVKDDLKMLMIEPHPLNVITRNVQLAI